MQAPNLIQFPDQLSRLESEAQNYLDKSLEAFRQFVDTLQVIQDSGLFSQYGTWDKYLRSRWGIAESTFRGYRAQSNTAEIMLSVVSETVTKAEAAKVSRILSKLPNDTELRLSAYAKAYEHTGKIAPSEAEIKIAYAEIERARKQDILTIDGVDYDAKALAIDANIQQELYELGKRKTAHIDASQGVESKRLDGTKAEIIAFLQSAPDSLYSLYWKESKQ